MMKTILRISRVLPILFALGHLTSCRHLFSTTTHKQIKLFIDSADRNYQKLFADLVEEYNRELGMTAIELVNGPDSANSLVLVRSGIQKQEGKVGWGQSTESVTIKRDNPAAILHLVPQKKDVYFGMQVEFDKEYIDRHLKVNSDINHYELKKLFAHEVGHGFKMEHSPNQNDVMYENIDGKKDFSTYYEQVRLFFTNE